MMGDRFVKYSLKPAATSRTHPTVRSAIVSAEDPGWALVPSQQSGKRASVQLVSLELKPMSRQTTPDTIKNSPP